MNFFKNLPIEKQHFLPPLIISLLALICYVFDQQLSDMLIFDRAAIATGEFWRTLTAHFFHTNINHLLLNLGAALLLWSLHGHFYQLKNYAITFAICSLGTSMGIYLFTPEINYYVGLSGVLHGIFVWGAMMDIANKEKTGYLLFIGVWLKIGHEQFFGASKDVEAMIGANVAIDAHLFGALSGLFITLAFFALRVRSRK